MSPLLRRLRRLIRDDAGAAAVTAALMMVPIIAVMGLSVDAGANYMLRRQAQNAADSAAFTAAVARRAGIADFVAQAKAVTDRYGLTDANGATVVVNTPPASGAYSGDGSAIEVIVQRPGALYFSSLLLAQPGTIKARAVARASPAGGCVYVLNPSAGNALLMNGNATIQVTGCSVFDNSSSSTALLMNGGSVLSAATVKVHGGDLMNGATVNGALQLHAGVTPDPNAALTLASIGVPTGGGCDQTSLVMAPKTFTAATPHVFCGGLTVQLPGTAIFQPGLYVFNGPVIVNSATSVTGSGVTFAFTSNGGITVNGGATLNLSAPATGPSAGILMIKDPSAPAGQMSIFNGNDQLALNGALYFPRQAMTLNSPVNMHGCISLFVDTLIVNGGSSLVSDCSNGGGGAPKLVE